jgi:hypothetical protein
VHDAALLPKDADYPQYLHALMLHHAFSAQMASVPHRKSLSHGPEGKPTGIDERWCGQNNARSCDMEVGRAGAGIAAGVARALQGALVAHAWLCSCDLKKRGDLTTRAPSAIRKLWVV